RVQDGSVISFDQMLREIRGVDLVFVGELHGYKRHQRAQLDVVRSLFESGIPVGIGLEMFRWDSQKALDDWVRGRIPPDEFVRIYNDNWRVPWPAYRDIFTYAREKKLDLVGLNVPDEITEKVARSGFSSLTPEELKKLPPGISCDIDQEYLDFIRTAHAAHGHKRGHSFTNFCEAQMVWDKAMAWHLLEYLKSNQGKTVVVIAGKGHTWKRGIPEQVRRGSSLKYRVILPETSGIIDRRVVTIHDADYLLIE
ncbi:MAG TPA: ChaN family lipoprotein, partial [Dissulfurispiraceae bacterium]|nr:ChaN family lipoprotein [Dissulfurispiraceae bacterium]